jgi:hypothetical protein
VSCSSDAAALADVAAVLMAGSGPVLIDLTCGRGTDGVTVVDLLTRLPRLAQVVAVTDDEALAGWAELTAESGVSSLVDLRGAAPPTGPASATREEVLDLRRELVEGGDLVLVGKENLLRAG